VRRASARPDILFFSVSFVSSSHSPPLVAAGDTIHPLHLSSPGTKSHTTKAPRSDGVFPPPCFLFFSPSVSNSESGDFACEIFARRFVEVSLVRLKLSLTSLFFSQGVPLSFLFEQGARTSSTMSGRASGPRPPLFFFAFFF